MAQCAMLDLVARSSPSLQALMGELQSSADVILPITVEEDRSILQDLENAGLDYIGSSSDSGKLASSKNRSAPCCLARLAFVKILHISFRSMQMSAVM